MLKIGCLFKPSDPYGFGDLKFKDPDEAKKLAKACVKRYLFKKLSNTKGKGNFFNMRKIGGSYPSDPYGFKNLKFEDPNEAKKIAKACVGRYLHEKLINTDNEVDFVNKEKLFLDYLEKLGVSVEKVIGESFKQR